MQAERIVITRKGGPETLQVRRFEAVPPAPAEIAIDVRAIGVNFADIFCRLGLYQAAPPIPFTPGFEVAGVVAAVGEGVTTLKTGDRVLAVTRFGGYTSRLNVRAEWARALPDGWGFEQGAAFPTVFLTAYFGLLHVGRLQSGETVVVQSAAGGVGTAACQIARDLGARVLGSVGDESKRSAALHSGAGTVLVSRDYTIWGEVDRLTEGKGVDLVLDAVGGPGLRQAFKRLKPGGRLVVYGFAEMMPRRGLRNWPLLAWKYLRTPRFNPLEMTGSNRTVSGFNLVYRWDRKQEFAEAMDKLLQMARDDRIRPVIGAIFPFREAARAHELLQSRGSTGKVVLTLP